jgi:hypothetical protein
MQEQHMRFTSHHRASARLPSQQLLRARLACEALEDRRLLNAAPLDAPLPSAVPLDESSSAGEVATPLTSLDDQIGLYRHGLLVQSFPPAADTDEDRGVALRSALAAAQDFDEIILGPYTFAMGEFEHVEFRDRLTVTGAGKELTKISSSCPQGNDGAATFTLNNESVIQDLWLEGSLHNGLYQPLVGMQGGPTEDVTAYLRRLKITGDSDGIFIWTGQVYQYTIYGYDIDINTRYDAIAVLGSGLNPQTVKLYNSTITVSQPSSIPTHISNAVNARSGFVGLYNCTVNVTGDANSLQTAGIWTWNQGSAEIVNCTFNVTAPHGFAYDLYIQNSTSVTVVGGTGSGPEGAYTSSSGSEVYATADPATIVQRAAFYNNSKFDDFQPRPGGHADTGAIAIDKTPLVVDAGRATFSNITSYDEGINGISIDLQGIHGSISADDFTLRVGNNNSPADWADAPAPLSVTVYGNAGIDNSDHIELVWADGAIRNTWLEVTIAANSDTRLATPETFYFGNAVGDSGLGDTANNATVNATDEIGARNNPANLAANIPITNIYDYDRNAQVNAADQIAARNNATNPTTVVKFINLTTAPAAPEADTEEIDLAATAASLAIAASPAAKGDFIAYPARLPVERLVTGQDAPQRTTALSSVQFGPSHNDDRAIDDVDDDLLALLLAGLNG